MDQLTDEIVGYVTISGGEASTASNKRTPTSLSLRG